MLDLVLSIAKLRVGQEAYTLSGVAQSLDDYYTGRGDRGVPHQDGGHCPPGQAKKGRC